MNMVTSQFIARKVHIAEPAQTPTELGSAPEIKGKSAHTSWDKRCEHRKKECVRIEAAKQSTPRLHETNSKTFSQRRESSKDMRLPPRPQQRSQSLNASPQAQTPKPQITTSGKGGGSSNNGRPLLQTTSGNASRFTAPAKVQIFERPATRSQHQDTTANKILIHGYPQHHAI